MNIVYLDLFITILSLTSLWLLIRLNRLGWSIAWVSSALNFYLLFQTHLYANFVLEIYFLITAVYGWLSWHKQQTKDEAAVYHLSSRQWALSLLSLVGLSLFCLWLLRFTDSTTVGMDAVTTALSIIAQLLLALRYIETWAFWFCADVIYIALYTEKHLPFHTLLMCCYLGLVVKGVSDWRVRLQSLAHEQTA